MHGSVVLDMKDLAGYALPHLDMFRVVTYPLSRIERMIARVERDQDILNEVLERSDKWTQRRIRDAVTRNCLKAV